MEVGNDGVRHSISVWRENELVRPSVIRLNLIVCGDICLQTAHDSHADCQNLMSFCLGLVYDFCTFRSDDKSLGIHFVLGQILDIHLAEITDTHVLSYECLVYVLESHHVKELPAEMKSCGRCRNRPLVLGENGLEINLVLRSCLLFHPLRDRYVAEAEQSLLEVLVLSVIKETQSPSPGSSVVDNFSHETVLSEIQLISDSDFSCRLHNHIPKSLLLVELPEKEYLDISSGLLLLSEKPCREYLRVIQYESVTFSEIIYNVFENFMLDLSGILVQNHHSALISPFPGRFMRYVLFQRNRELKLR